MIFLIAAHEIFRDFEEVFFVVYKNNYIIFDLYSRFFCVCINVVLILRGLVLEITVRITSLHCF